MNSSKIGDSFLFGAFILLTGSVIRMGASIYLPAMPIIGKELGITSSAMSNTISAYFIIFSSFIIVAGALSDRFGRKPLLLFGMIFFAIGSIVCATSDGYDSLIVGRMIQAFGASMIPGTLMAMIQDACGDTRAISLIGWLSVLSGLFLVASPVIGGILTHYIGWRSNFWFLSFFTAIVFASSLFLITETHTKPISLNIKQTIKTMFMIIFSSQFSIVLLPAIFFFAIQGIFLSSAPYIVMEQYHLRSIEFGASNIFVVIGLFAGRYVGANLFKKCQAQCIYTYGIYTLIFSTILFLLYGIGFIDNLWGFLSIMGIFAFNLGMVSPISMRGSISAFRSNSGLASAIQGALLLGASGVGSFLIGFLIKELPSISITSIFGFLNGLICFMSIVVLYKIKNTNF